MSLSPEGPGGGKFAGWNVEMTFLLAAILYEGSGSCLSFVRWRIESALGLASPREVPEPTATEVCKCHRAWSFIDLKRAVQASK